ncbi:ketopantoate reductase family protein [Haliea sp. E17]|uniref:ketopantoate reductase family protein n=1 Tax=Haliea sp. E17 TaxID=3401576 RepID=UPI003AAC5EB1
MSAARVLIVGAGALGLTTGYHLQRAGADITFLVRPHRLAALARPQRLYSYDEQHCNLLENFEVVGDPEQLRGTDYDFILLTLDGATCFSEQGTMTLSILGEIFRGGRAVLIINGVGLGLYDHIRRTTGLPEARLLEGTMKMFAYMVGAANAPQPAPQDRAEHDGADVAYINFPDHVGFFVTTAPKAPARAFAELFSASGVATCKTIPTRLYRMSTNIFSAFTIASELNGWAGTESLVADPQLWPLCCESQREMLRLRRNGFMGRLMAWLMSDKRIADTMRKSDREAAPMGLTEFNRCHHGGKVVAQNVGILERCLAEGESAGQQMPATRELVQRWQRQHATG